MNFKPAIPYVAATRPRCPSCRSFKLIAYKTIDQGDESILRYCRCKDCGEPVKVVYEPSGESE